MPTLVFQLRLLTRLPLGWRLLSNGFTLTAEPLKQNPRLKCTTITAMTSTLTVNLILDLSRNTLFDDLLVGCASDYTVKPINLRTRLQSGSFGNHSDAGVITCPTVSNSGVSEITAGETMSGRGARITSSVPHGPRSCKFKQDKQQRMVRYMSSRSTHWRTQFGSHRS